MIKKPWPGLMQQVYGELEGFKNTYLVQFPCRIAQTSEGDILTALGKRDSVGALKNSTRNNPEPREMLPL